MFETAPLGGPFQFHLMLVLFLEIMFSYLHRRYIRLEHLGTSSLRTIMLIADERALSTFYIEPVMYGVWVVSSCETMTILDRLPWSVPAFLSWGSTRSSKLFWCTNLCRVIIYMSAILAEVCAPGGWQSIPKRHIWGAAPTTISPGSFILAVRLRLNHTPQALTVVFLPS